MSRAEITPALIRELIDYNPDTGELTWRRRAIEYFAHCKYPKREVARWNTRYAGTPALNHEDKKYLRGAISIRGDEVSVSAHRIAWAHYYGKWPEHEVDHIKSATGKPYDNRISNLRDVPHSENNKNASRRKDNASGTTGVHWMERLKKHCAYITVNRKQIHLGVYEDEQDAIAARKAAEIKYGFHENHGSKA